MHRGEHGPQGRSAEPGASVLEQLQHNEYERYAVQIDVTGRTAVLTGTAALVRTEALAAVARARGVALPGPPGAVYAPGAITEDSELTLALRTLGYELASPLSMSCTTELMPTPRDLHRQRVRWYKGMLDNLRAYGLTRVTARYYGQQVMLAVSTLMLMSLVLITALTLVTGTFQVVPFWLGVGAVIVTERLVTVWRGGPRGRLLAAAVLPEVGYDVFVQIAFLRACWMAATARDAARNHVHRSDPNSSSRARCRMKILRQVARTENEPYALHRVPAQASQVKSGSSSRTERTFASHCVQTQEKRSHRSETGAAWTRRQKGTLSNLQHG